MLSSLPLVREFSQQRQVPTWGDFARPIEKVISSPLFRQICGRDGGFAQQNLLNKGFDFSLFTPGFGLHGSDGIIKADLILDREGVKTMMRIGALGNDLLSGGHKESPILFGGSPVSSNGLVSVFLLLCVGIEGGSDLNGFGDGLAAMKPDMTTTTLLISGGDDGNKEVVAARVGSAKVSFEWAFEDAFGLRPQFKYSLVYVKLVCIRRALIVFYGA
ncbi:hypothetical protein ACLB2K_039641 [Fragaria x ananassa]